MLRIVLAIAAVLLLAGAHGAAAGEPVRQPPRHAAPFSPAKNLPKDLTKNLPKNLAQNPVNNRRFTLPLLKAVICRPSEKQCRMASYITWCCRADQECDYSTVGGCR